MSFSVISGKIRALSPLHLGSGLQTGNFYPTLSYIPGRAIRGMLGNYLFHEDRGLFEELRIKEAPPETGIYFRPALPEGTVAVPGHLKWCKRCGRRLRDMEPCPEDGHEGKKSGGFILIEGLKIGRLSPPELKRTISTKCPIMRKGHASPGSDEPLSPYNIEAIVQGSVFDFRCLVEEGLESEVMKALEKAGLFFGIGGFRSKGYGLVKFEGLRKIEDPMEAVKGRTMGDWLVLNSPGVFRNGEGKYLVGLKSDAGVVERYAKESLRLAGVSGELRLTGEQFVSQDYARGWSIEGKSHLDSIIPAT
ncbi:MAG: hypothetical protein KAU14_00190, partial [Thermoplasmata archaeon]|nr:hypothetical protein [Thermoplasmata archaeon]